WNPGVAGRYRVWISWGCGSKTHAPDARYVLDRDGDLATRDDQELIARADHRLFADGRGKMPGQPLWSGLLDAGTRDLLEASRIVLRGGETDAVITADLVLLQPAGSPDDPAPSLRAAVDPRRVVERFTPRAVRYVRFTVLETNGAEPCIDELEVFTVGEAGGEAPRNVALATAGARFRSSSDYAGNPKHKLEHIGDGRHGNDHSWISGEPGKGRVEIELAEVSRVGRIVWARDRQGKYKDRLATRYRIEVARERGDWTTVASSDDRLPRGAPGSESFFVGLGDAEAEELGRLLARRDSLQGKLREETDRRMVYAGKFTAPAPTHVLHRGDPLQKRDEVRPGGIAALGRALELAKDAPERERRLALARWIADPANPLTSRVLVNRLWHYHFGEGLVNTPSDFGANGGHPSHPELLDWLATELIRRGGSLKEIHRLIVLSSTYRQSSAPREEALRVDADSRLLWRYPPRRLEAEPIRDAVLAVSGALALTGGGPGFDVFEPNSNYVHVYVPRKKFGPAEWRRMIYQFKPRMEQDETFGIFDCPDAAQVAPRRTRSTTPLQALNLLNSPFMLEQSRIFAQRLKEECGGSPPRQVRRAFRLALGRPPDPEESAAALDLVREHGLVILARALFNANEFLYVH
ncbi:MAG: DUF1553 domain-containing protein, partial [Planctomycetota bacterium]|nr:DUF1553 domain-containing protein [Planctomycetota bacterium]